MSRLSVWYEHRQRSSDGYSIDDHVGASDNGENHRPRKHNIPSGYDVALERVYAALGISPEDAERKRDVSHRFLKYCANSISNYVKRNGGIEEANYQGIMAIFRTRAREFIEKERNNIIDALKPATH